MRPTATASGDGVIKSEYKKCTASIVAGAAKQDETGRKV